MPPRSVRRNRRLPEQVRDLLAVLPVEEVHVLGRMNGNDQLDVTFRRSQMLKRKMAFLIPADFVEECGGRLEG